MSITNSQTLLKLMSIELVMPSNHLILCRPLLLLPSIFSSIRVFSNQSVPIRWSKYWSFSFSISPSNEHLGLIYFRIDWLDLLAVQGTLKSFSNTIVQKHQFFNAQLSFMVQLSHPYTTTGKTITLTRRTFVVKGMSQLFNKLSGFVMASLVAQRVKNLPAVWETQFQSLGWEDPLEKEMATHSRTLGHGWMDGGAWQATVHVVANSRT